MWTTKNSDGKVLYILWIMRLIPSCLQPGQLLTIFLELVLVFISSQGGYVYVYMQDKLYYYATADLLNGVATS